jgi:prepilin-type processing-associated H-X9-DG protein
LAHLKATEGNWGMGTPGGGPCYIAWPPGWGGTVTDSVTQQQLAVAGALGESAHKAFRQSIGTASHSGMKMVEVGDPVNFYIVGDGGAQTAYLFGVGICAYPDICALECANSVFGWADWEICTWAADCGLYTLAPNDGSFLANPELRKPYTRHLGGVNCGFLDGHAQWIASEALVRKVRDGDLEGIFPWGPTSDCGIAEACPGVPTIW